MQVKTIEKRVEWKLNQWLNSITDENLRKRVKDNLLVSGGCVASMFLKEPVNDYDVYIQDVNVLKDLVKYYIVGVDGIQVFDGRLKNEMLQDSRRKDDGIGYYYSAVRTLKENQIKLFFESKKGGMKVETQTENDIDKYITNDDEIVLRVPEDLVSKSSENKKAPEYKPVFFSPNAISLSDDIQIVLRFWGTPDKIHETFDFVHATNYFTFKDGLVRNMKALESLIGKQLRYQGSHYPLTSIIRMKKFIKRGWNITAGEILKIMIQISKLDLSDPDVLEEQLIGVDVAYFETLITAVRSKLNSDEQFKLDDTYIFEIIDRIFNGEAGIE